MRFQKSLLVGLLIGFLASGQVLSSPEQLVESSESIKNLEEMDKPDALNADSFELRLASQEKITQHKEKIARTIRRHWYARIGLGVGGAALFTYTVVKFARSWFSSPSNTPVTPAEKSNKQDFRPITKEDMRVLLAAQAKFSANQAKLCPPVFSGGWFKNKASYLCEYFVLNSVLGSLALAAGSKLYSRFFHEDTIEWFASEKTKIERLSAELRVYAQKFGLRGMKEVRVVKDPVTGRTHREVREHLPVEPRVFSPEELHCYRVTLAGICRDLVIQAESLAGFMEYSLDQFKKQGVFPSPDEILQRTRLVASVNAFVRFMQKFLPPTKGQPDSTGQIKQPLGAALRFSIDVKELINRFSGIENSVAWRMINGG